MNTVQGPVLVWGAGAIGGTIGAYLARAGVDLHFVDVDADHVAEINRAGLAIEGPVENFIVPARASVPEDVSGRFDRIWLCTKAQHTATATRQLAPFLTENGHVLSLQNGLNELIIAETIGRERTLGAFINFGADYLAPGRILYGGRGAVVVGELDGSTTPRLVETHRLLMRFDDQSVMTPNIWGYLWGKLGYGALLFATALTNESIADVLAMPAYRPMLVALASEMTALADAQGIEPLGFNGYEPTAFRPGATAAQTTTSFDAMVAHNARSAKSHSGIWRDLAVRKRKTEVDPQLTVPIDVAAKLGRDLPLTRRLVELIQDIEEGRRPLSFDTLGALKAHHEGGR